MLVDVGMSIEGYNPMYDFVVAFGRLSINTVENRTQLLLNIRFHTSAWSYQASNVNTRKGTCPRLVST